MRSGSAPRQAIAVRPGCPNRSPGYLSEAQTNYQRHPGSGMNCSQQKYSEGEDQGPQAKSLMLSPSINT